MRFVDGEELDPRRPGEVVGLAAGGGPPTPDAPDGPAGPSDAGSDFY